jgi:hypothetical protein
MYFDNYKDHSQARFNPGLFWEYDLSRFDFGAQTALVVQRVIERGASEDFYALFNLYGVETVRDTIKEIPTFSQRDIEFISNIMGIPYTELKAYKNTTTPFQQKHWQHSSN